MTAETTEKILNHEVSLPPRKNSRKDALKYTWRTQDRSSWTIYHWFYEILGLYHSDLGRRIPVHEKQTKVPFLSNWSMLGWIILHGVLPMTLHHACMKYTGRTMPLWQVLIVYNVTMIFTAVRGQQHLRGLSHELGFLDAKSGERQGIPDAAVEEVFFTLNTLLSGRCSLIAWLAYSNLEAPGDIAWYWLPVKMAIYSITFDFWYYWYHRSLHEIPLLRKHQRKHHMSRHPTTLMTAFADFEQSVFDYIVCPVVTYYFLNSLGLSLSFYEWWICNLQTFITEVGGHSGLRMYASPPNLFHPLLLYFNCDLSLEDHDLHHRTGWKESGNFGSQTRLWDTVFATRKERVETKRDDVDWDNPVPWPIF
ncbi:hypothetical protein VHEMI01711 [[Torrubiella] hemipterigena]|uniref:Fatty acid hydroxylase domain-containing protein n=1 Tax=[Torrubiella] hemipterigena TaxID=1531966 RepID=A0A0A1STU1_9HYPO|nr:hypothetical protein VHEMI01711 [[Torrubiella] hemipterigena]